MSGWLGFSAAKGAAIISPQVASIQLQQAGYGVGIPIVYGTMRVPGRIIDYDDFVSIPHPESQGVGKGGGGNVTSVKYTYTVTILMGLSEGPIGGGIGIIWGDKDIGTLSSFGFSLFTGTRTQSPWGFMTTNHPAKALGYGGTAYVAAAPLDLGSTGQLKNFSFEVQGILYGAAAWAVGDVAPDAMIADLLTNAFYGVGIPGGAIGTWTQYITYCRAMGFGMSQMIAEQRTAASYIREWLDATNSELVHSQGLFQVVPYGDQTVSGNSVTYNPNVTPVYALTTDDLIPFGDGSRVQVTRIPLSDTYNVMPVDFLDRGQDYNTSTVQDPEPVDADLYGQRMGATFSCKGITRQDHALRLSRIRAQRSVYVRNTYKFQLKLNKCLLDPMDLVTLTSDQDGLAGEFVRVMDITENADGSFIVTAQQWPFGVGNSAGYAAQTNSQSSPNTNVAPGNATIPVFVEIPLLYDDRGVLPRLLIGTSGGANWGGCEVWVSGNGTTYALAGIIRQKARQGVLTATLATNAVGLDSTHTLGVDLSSSQGQLVSVTTLDASDNLNLCWVDGELLSFKDATLVSGYTYNLTNLYRGAYSGINGAGAAPSAHSAGTKFVRIDDALLEIPVPASRVGVSLYVKLVSFNIFGGGKQAIGSVSAYNYTPTPLQTTKLAPTIALDRAVVGASPFAVKDPLYRALNAMANSGVTASDRTWYRGNADASTLGGAPAIARLTLTPRSWDTAGFTCRLDWKLHPTVAADNLDAMRYAKVELFRQSVAGTTATLTTLGVHYARLTDRLYADPSNDANTVNDALGSHPILDSGITAGVPAMRVTIYNASGPSDTHCFYSAAGWAAGTALTDNGVSWPAGITGAGGGGSGGGGGGGGTCPVHETPVLLADGESIRAGGLCVGMRVWTMHEETLEWGAAIVSAVSSHFSECLTLALEDGRELVASPNHRVYVRAVGWREIASLAPGDEIVGAMPAKVREVTRAGRRGVMKVTVDRAATFVTAGILSHNNKPL